MIEFLHTARAPPVAIDKHLTFFVGVHCATLRKEIWAIAIATFTELFWQPSRNFGTLTLYIFRF